MRSGISCQSQGAIELKSSSSNGSICSCNPGFFFLPIDSGWGRCVNFSEVSGAENATSKVEPSMGSLPILSGLSRAAPSTFVWTTFALAGLWLLLTIPLLLRAPKSGIGYRLRQALTSWDRRYSLRHWVDDQKCLIKRSTELGGIMSVASWILFTGLASSLAYEAISSDTTTIQYMVPATRKDITMFRNDIEINVTTVGQLQCSQFVGSNLSLRSDGGYILKASTEDFGKPVCMDTLKGPLFRLSCKSCVVTSDKYLFTWEFQDQLNANPTASAVGFIIDASATAFMPHRSTLTATLPGGYNGTSTLAATLRGSDWNVIRLNFVPRTFKSKGDPKLIQIVFHTFTPGSNMVSIKEMEDAFAKQQGVKIALQVKVLSQYLVETAYRSNFGIVKFLAYLGGLYISCRFLFLIIMIQCESNFPKLLDQEKRFNRLVARERARAHWAKVRTYVKYGKFSNAGKYGVQREQIQERNYIREFMEPNKTHKDFVESCQFPAEGTSRTGIYGDSNASCSRHFVRQYRKPTWICELEALPPVPEPPDFAGHLNNEGDRYVYLQTAHEYLKNLCLYSTRLRRDFLATLTVLEKVASYFGLYKT